MKNVEKDTKRNNSSRDHLQLQDAESWRACAFGKLIVHENGMAGIAMEGLRALFPTGNDVSLFRKPNTLLLDDEAKLHELWDFAVMSEWENSRDLRPLVVKSLEWLCNAAAKVGGDLRATWS